MCVNNCGTNTNNLYGGDNFYGDDISGYCVDKCTIINNSNNNNTLVEYYYGDNITSRCVSRCPDKSYGHL